jgi:adenylate cyclase
MASRLHRTVVASAAFAQACPDRWEELGEFPIAGFSKAERVYGLSDETAGAHALPLAGHSSGSVVNSSG